VPDIPLDVSTKWGVWARRTDPVRIIHPAAIRLQTGYTHAAVQYTPGDDFLMTQNIHTIYLVHHSHTDIGYTQDQPIVWEMHSRFIDEALLLTEKYQDHATDGAFRWTVETTGVLDYWLRHATDDEIDRFIALEKSGRVEVTGMFANVTPLYDTDQLIESFQILRRLRNDYGFRIEYAMNCDVNGQNWPLTDVLLDVGIRGFTMAINTHFGGAFQPRPYTFQWEAPSGRTIPVNNGWPYDKAWREGVGRSQEEFDQRWQRLQAHLHAIGYPLPILLLQTYHPYGDNGSAFDFTPFLDEWNAHHEPRIVMATPRMWWQAVQDYADQLQTFRGDWTDFWNFGSISSAHEQRLNRLSRAQLRTADAVYGALNQVTPAPGWAHKAFARHRQAAWQHLNLWDEHTWGADVSVRLPENDDTRTQWYHKADYAHKARSLSTLLQREAVGDFARQVARANADDILLFNPLPWPRTIAGQVPYFVANPRGVASDSTAGRQHQDRKWMRRREDSWHRGEQYLLPPTAVPAFGYTVIPRDQLVSDKAARWLGEDAVVSNHRYVITFDRETGGITSLYDKTLDWELVPSGQRLNRYVHEEVADTAAEWARHMLFYQDWNAELAEIPTGWKTGWHARREGARRVIQHKVYQMPHGLLVTQALEAKGIDGTLTQEIFLPDYADYIECSAHWSMTLNTHPEATYLVFPFNVPDATARYDLGGQAVIAGDEQLPGVCRDYFTVQGWVDFNNGARGVRVATPENPLVQFGDFHFGHYQSEFTLEQAMLLGWVTNNYWETNFRAHQPGQVQARYRIQPYAGAFDEARAHQFGAEALYDLPVFQHLGEPLDADDPLPSTASLLSLPQGPVVVLHIKQAENNDSVIIRLLNASDREQSAQIGSGLLTIQSASVCDLLEQDGEALPVTSGAVQVKLPPRGLLALRCRFG
jgi:alpha-mannosidase